MNFIIKFQVIDTGIGIDKANQAKLFNLFEQVSNQHTQAGGLGMGLAISQLIVQQMGGVISVESQLGQGSQFSFSLDLPICDKVPVLGVEMETSELAESTGETHITLSPNREELKDLLHLAQIGLLRKMRQKLEELVEKDKRYTRFAHSILVLEKEYKIDEIEELLNEHLALLGITP